MVSCYSIPIRDARCHSPIRFGFVYYTHMRSMPAESGHKSHIHLQDALKLLR